MGNFLLVLFFAVFCSAENAFVYPPPMGTGNLSTDVILQLNEVAQIKWVTNKDVYNVTLWQQDVPSSKSTVGKPIYTKAEHDKEMGGYNWTVDIQSFSLSTSPVFYLALVFPSDTHMPKLPCHYFNVTDSGISVTANSSGLYVSASTSTAAATSTAASSVTCTTTSTETVYAMATSMSANATTTTSAYASYYTINSSSSANATSTATPTSAANSTRAYSYALSTGLGVCIGFIMLLSGF